MSDNRLPNQDHSELLMLYETSVAEIAGFKQQQWAVTYYVLIAQAATVAIAQAILKSIQGTDRFFLTAILALTLGLGLVVLRSLQTSIELRRDRLRDTREHFGELFKNARSGSKEPDPVPVILAAAQMLGAFVAGWLVVARL